MNKLETRRRKIVAELMDYKFALQKEMESVQELINQMSGEVYRAKNQRDIGRTASGIKTGSRPGGTPEGAAEQNAHRDKMGGLVD